MTTSPLLIKTIQQASNLLRQKQFQSAAAMLEQALKSFPGQADLLQLLGSAKVHTGDLHQAEIFYRRSLEINHFQAHVELNLGHLLRKQGRYEAALDAYQKAIRLKPKDAEYHHAFAVALHNCGRFSESERAYRNSLRLAPSLTAAKVGLAGTLVDLKRPQEAVVILSRACSETADSNLLAVIENYLGLANVALGSHTVALEHFARAETVHPSYSSDHGRARALQSLGRDEEAVTCLRRAVAINPLNMAAHYELNQLLYRLGRDSEFLLSYDAAAKKVPAATSIPVAKADFLTRSGRPADALDLFASILHANPECMEAARGKASALVGLEQFESATEIFQSVLKTTPHDFETLVNLSMTSLSAANPELAANAAERALDIRAHDQMALAALALAWRTLGDEREQEFNNYETMVQIFDLEPPAGYSSMASFNLELDSYLDALHPKAREYLNQSLRGGTQTADILNIDHPLITGLRQRIEEAIQRYIQGMRQDGSNQFLSRLAENFMFAGSWSSRLHDRGFHTNHVHPAGWISSAYYVAVPEIVTNSSSQEGWIKFGEPPKEMRLRHDARRLIQPKPGRLVLFPSYMWHGTVPFSSTESRTTVAFDIIPAT